MKKYLNLTLILLMVVGIFVSTVQAQTQTKTKAKAKTCAKVSSKSEAQRLAAKRMQICHQYCSNLYSMAKRQLAGYQGINPSVYNQPQFAANIENANKQCMLACPTISDALAFNIPIILDTNYNQGYSPAYSSSSYSGYNPSVRSCENSCDMTWASCERGCNAIPNYSGTSGYGQSRTGCISQCTYIQSNCRASCYH